MYGFPQGLATAGRVDFDWLLLWSSYNLSVFEGQCRVYLLDSEKCAAKFRRVRLDVCDFFDKLGLVFLRCMSVGLFVLDSALWR